MAGSNVDINVNLITKQAQANAKALEKSAIGVTAAWTGFLVKLELVQRAFGALAGAYSATIGSANQLEAAIGEVTTLLGETAGVQAQLTDEILGFQKQFGADAITTTKAYYQAISAGAVDASNAQDLLTAANKLAIGGVTDVETAINGLTNIMAPYGVTTENVAQVSDALFIAMKAGKTTVGELARSIGQVASPAAGLGISFQEVLASTAAVTTAGVETSVAMTQLKAVLANLSKPTADLEKALKKAGITSLETSLRNEGLVGTLRKIQGTTDGTVSGLNKLFGSTEAASFAVTVLSENIGGKFTSILSDMQTASLNAGQATQEAFDKIAATSEFKLKVLNGNIKAFGTQIGIVLGPAFNAIIDLIAELVTEAGTFFEENKKTFFDFAKTLSDGIKGIVAGFKNAISILSIFSDDLIALGAGLGASIAVYSAYTIATKGATAATSLFAGAVKALNAALTFAASPIGIAVIAIGALTAAGVFIYQNFDRIKETFLSLAKQIKEVMTPSSLALREAIISLTAGITAAGLAVVLYNNYLKGLSVSTVANTIATKTMNAAKLTAATITKAYSASVAALSVVFSKATLTTIAQTVATKTLTVAKNTANIATKALTASTTALRAAFTFLTGPIGIIITTVTALTAASIYAYRNFEEVEALFFEIASTISKFVIPAINFLVEVFTSVRQAINVVSAGFKLYYATLGEVALFINSTFIAALDGLLFGIEKLAGVFSKDLASAIGKARKTMQELKNTVQEKIDATKKDAIETIKNKGATEDLEKQNKSLKAGYVSLVNSLDKTAKETRKHADEVRKQKKEQREQNSVLNKTDDILKKSNKTIKASRTETKKLEVATQNLTSKTETQAQATSGASKEQDEYTKKLADLRSEIDKTTKTASLLERQYKLIDSDKELSAIAEVLGRQKTATALAETERLKSIGKIKEAELTLAQLQAEYQKEAIIKADDERIKSIEERKKQEQTLIQENAKLALKRIEDEQEEDKKRIEETKKLNKENAKLFRQELVATATAYSDALKAAIGLLPGFIRESISGLVVSVGQLADGLGITGIGVYLGDELTNAFEGSSPALQSAMTTGVELLKSGAQAFTSILSASVSFLQTGFSLIQADFLNAVTSAISTVGSIPAKLGEGITGLRESITTATSNFGGEFVTGLIGNISQLSNDFPSLASSFITNIIDNAPKLLDAILDSIPRIIEALADGLPKLIQQIVKAIPRIADTFIKALPAIFRSIIYSIRELTPPLTKAFVAAFTAIIQELPALFDAILDQIPIIIDGILQVIPALISKLPDLIDSILEQIPGIIDAIIGNLPAIIFAIIEAIPQIIFSIIENIPFIVDALIRNLPLFFGEIIKNLPSLTMNLTTGLIKAMPSIALAFLTNLIPGMKLNIGNIFQGIGGWFANVFSSIKTAIFDPFANVLGSIANVFDGIFKWIKDNVIAPIQNLIGQAKAVIEAPKKAASGATNAVKSTVKKVRSFLGFADGGLIGGQALYNGDNKRNDIIPALLSPGELVIPRTFVKNGLQGVLEFASMALNQQKQSFAYGGVVSGSSSSGSASDLSISSEIAALRKEIQEIGTVLARDSRKTARLLERWDGDGIPSDRGY